MNFTFSQKMRKPSEDGFRVEARRGNKRKFIISKATFFLVQFHTPSSSQKIQQSIHLIFKIIIPSLLLILPSKVHSHSTLSRRCNCIGVVGVEMVKEKECKMQIVQKRKKKELSCKTKSLHEYLNYTFRGREVVASFLIEVLTDGSFIF